MLNIDDRLIKEVSPKIGPNALSVLLAIAIHLNQKTGRCFPSHARLMELTGLGKNAVYDALKVLRENNLLATEQHKDTKNNRFGRRMFWVTTRFIGIFITAEDAEPVPENREPENREPENREPENREPYLINNYEQLNEFNELEGGDELESENAPEKSALSATIHTPQPPIENYQVTTVEHAVIDLEEKPKAKPAAKQKKQTATWKVDPETEIEELRNDDLCKERLYRQCRIPLELFDEYVSRFELKVGSEQAEHNNRRDFRSHFFNWASLEYVREQKGQRPTANTPDGLLKEISAWYNANPKLWYEAKQYGRVQNWSDAKLTALVTQFCAWQIKNGNGGDTFAQHNAGIQSWFLRETKAAVAAPSMNGNGREHLKEPQFRN